MTVIGLDLAKNVFEVHGIDDSGHAVLKRKLRRSEVLPFFAGLKAALVGIEACHTAHYWGREIAALGHDLRLMPPQFVKPYGKSQRNATAAEAIAEAAQRPTMRFAPIKSADQQALLMLRREVTPNKCYATCGQFADTTLTFPGGKVPRRRADFRASVTGNFRVLSPKYFRVMTQTDYSPSGQIQLYLVGLPRLQLGRTAPSMFFSKLLKCLLSKAIRGLREIWMVGFIFAQIKLKINVNGFTIV